MPASSLAWMSGAGVLVARPHPCISFELVGRDAQYVMPPRGRGVRPPSWAAREAMVDAGIATTDDVERWDRALTNDLENVVNTFIAAHLIIGRTPQR